MSGGERATDRDAAARRARSEAMMRRWMVAGLLAGALGAPVTATAQEVVREADRTEYKKKTVIDFSDVTIQGELTKPEGSYVLNRKKTKFRTLLKLRGNFLPELRNSTDNL
jgi:hypothetical protein